MSGAVSCHSRCRNSTSIGAWPANSPVAVGRARVSGVATTRSQGRARARARASSTPERSSGDSRVSSGTDRAASAWAASRSTGVADETNDGHGCSRRRGVPCQETVGGMTSDRLRCLPGKLTRSCCGGSVRPGNFTPDPSADDPVRAAHALVERMAHGGGVVYGVNTGFGKLARRRIAENELDRLQRNLIRSHAVGVGAALPR